MNATCPECGTVLAISNKQLGAILTCPSCGATLQVVQGADSLIPFIITWLAGAIMGAVIGGSTGVGVGYKLYKILHR